VRPVSGRLSVQDKDGDRLYADLIRTEEKLPHVVELIARLPDDEQPLLAVLRRPLPHLFLERLALSPPWSDRPRVLAAVVRNPRAGRVLGLKLLPGLFWRDLAEIAVAPQVHGAVRARAESLLQERLEELRLGDRVSLARLSTPPVLRRVLRDPEPRVLRAALSNPRLREADLREVVRSDSASRQLLEEVVASARWREAYAVRLELVLQPRTPLALALAQLTSLTRPDLLRVADTPGLVPLLQRAAHRVASTARTS
jgi:hypothetical protein